MMIACCNSFDATLTRTICLQVWLTEVEGGEAKREGGRGMIRKAARAEDIVIGIGTEVEVGSGIEERIETGITITIETENMIITESGRGMGTGTGIVTEVVAKIFGILIGVPLRTDRFGPFLLWKDAALFKVLV